MRCYFARILGRCQLRQGGLACGQDRRDGLDPGFRQDITVRTRDLLDQTVSAQQGELPGDSPRVPAGVALLVRACPCSTTGRAWPCCDGRGPACGTAWNREDSACATDFPRFPAVLKCPATSPTRTTQPIGSAAAWPLLRRRAAHPARGKRGQGNCGQRNRKRGKGIWGKGMAGRGIGRGAKEFRAREWRAEELEEGQRNFGQGNEEEDF